MPGTGLPTGSASGAALLEKERDYLPASRGPTGFHWLVDGLLGGMRRPGVLTKTRHDIEALARMNVSLLVTLNENWSPPVDELAAHGIDSFVHKITDLHAPDAERALATCRYVDGYLAHDRACIYHCRAGIGRTGTMLAAQLMYYGFNASDAIQAVRAKNPKWIQSEIQLEFLPTFGEYLQNLSSNM